MKALINLGNNTTVSIIGTSEEVSDCYLNIVRGLLDMQQDDQSEADDCACADNVIEIDEAAADQLLDYIISLRQKTADNQYHDDNNGGDVQ